MKKQFLVLALGLVMSLSATAQREKRQNVNSEQRAEMAALRMKHKLGLSEEQHKKVEALNKSKAAEMLKKQEAMKAQRKAEAEAYKAQLKQILTAEQYAKFEAGTQERKEKREQHGNKPHQRRGRG